jgi:hypothetical protein
VKKIRASLLDLETGSGVDVGGGDGVAEGRVVGPTVCGMGVAVGGRSASVGEMRIDDGSGVAQPTTRISKITRIAVTLNFESMF